MAKFHRYPALVEAGYINNRMTLHRRISAGTFPPPFDLGKNTRAWAAGDLEEVDRRILEGITEPNLEWLARVQRRKSPAAA